MSKEALVVHAAATTHSKPTALLQKRRWTMSLSVAQATTLKRICRAERSRLLHSSPRKLEIPRRCGRDKRSARTGFPRSQSEEKTQDLSTTVTTTPAQRKRKRKHVDAVGDPMLAPLAEDPNSTEKTLKSGTGGRRRHVGKRGRSPAHWGWSCHRRRRERFVITQIR